MSENNHAQSSAKAPSLRAMALAALGVVYGDIGTSPLYALRECFLPGHGVSVTPENVLGVLSLITWSLTLVVAIKYLTFVLNADNEGEGGTLALLALVISPREGSVDGYVRTILITLALVGSTLLYGDAAITPAISVLGAIEGLEVATPFFKAWVVPMTLAILVALFMLQRRGTGGIGAIFGPTMLVWFATLALIGVPWIVRVPEVLAALNPLHGVRFLIEHSGHGFLLLGAVVLCVTGAEAVYADMGHFGKRPIRIAWFAAAFPGLLLNYFGQGALLLSQGEKAVGNPFYGLVSGFMIYPLVVLATAAAVVASQAMISGAFSLTNQAVQLGYCPRLRIVHTSGHREGEIYIPEVNALLAVTCVAIVIAFPSSSALAAAYGIAVTGTMTMTSILYFWIARRRWGAALALPLVAAFLTIDLSFLGANLIKVRHGGWLPLIIAAMLFTVFSTWKRGRSALGERLRAAALPLEPFLLDLATHDLPRVPGNAVFMTGNPDAVPPALLHHLKHNKSLHARVLLLSIITSHVPGIRRRERVQSRELGHGIFQIVAHYGFMQTPHVSDMLRTGKRQLGIDVELEDTSFYLGRETLIVTGRSRMWRWRATLFAFLSRNAHSATEFFGLPPGRVVELGMQIEI